MGNRDLLLLALARRLASSGEGRRIRQGAAVSLAEIGKTVGAAESTVYRWETGARRPRGAPAIAWAELMRDLERAGAR